jgi:hypothetical protein
MRVTQVSEHKRLNEKEIQESAAFLIYNASAPVSAICGRCQFLGTQVAFKAPTIGPPSVRFRAFASATAE